VIQANELRKHIMPRVITLRSDFTGQQLRGLARRSKDASQARRLLALAVISDGGTRSEAARLGCVTLQIVRDWVLRFNTEGPLGLIERHGKGRPPLLTAAHRVALAAMLERGPIPAIHGVMRWRLCDLGQWLWEEFRVSVSVQTLTGAALVLPFCTTAGKNLHLAEISKMVRPRRHAVLLLDQAGWHMSGQVEVPANITLLPLPPKCPELNVMENVWQFMRDNWLSNLVFHDHNDITGHCCFYWNRLIDQPWRITSIGMRDWAHRS